MIIKEIDSRKDDINELKELLAYSLSQKQRFLIEREINNIIKGERGEKDSAYYINFYYGHSKGWVVIHDLKLRLGEITAQIDHLLINRFFDIYVLESKNFQYGLKITQNGEFEVPYKNQYIGIPSPIEQNLRHISLLKNFIKHYNLLPERLSIPIPPSFFNYVLVSPNSFIKRPKSKVFDSSNVIKADALATTIDKNIDNVGNLEALSKIAKVTSFTNIQNFAKKLVRFHKPSKTDWKKRFGISENIISKKINNTGYYCYKCKSTISLKEAKFCWNNKEKFKGKAFCFNCQQQI